MRPFEGYAKLPSWENNITLEMGLTKFNKRGVKLPIISVSPYRLIA